MNLNQEKAVDFGLNSERLEAAVDRAGDEQIELDASEFQARHKGERPKVADGNIKMRTYKKAAKERLYFADLSSNLLSMTSSSNSDARFMTPAVFGFAHAFCLVLPP